MQCVVKLAVGEAAAIVLGIFTWDRTLFCSPAASIVSALLQATSLLISLPLDFCAGNFVGLFASSGACAASAWRRDVH